MGNNKYIEITTEESFTYTFTNNENSIGLTASPDNSGVFDLGDTPFITSNIFGQADPALICKSLVQVMSLMILLTSQYKSLPQFF